MREARKLVPAVGAVLSTFALASCGAGTVASAPPPAAVARPPVLPAAPAAPVLMAPADLDRMLEAQWKAAGVAPAAAADDAEVLRRTTLDLIGRVPTLEEAERFLADGAADKRARLVERLLAAPDYAEHWADMSMDLFVGRQFRKPRLERTLDPRAFFVAAFRDNLAYDRVAREMLTFSGEIRPNGPGVFLASHLKGGGPEAMASATARLFLGVQIQCAQCHDHPTDARYKQDDFFGLAAYFARTRAREQKIETAAAAQPEEAKPADPDMAAAAAGTDPPAKAPVPKRYLVFEKPNGKTKFKRPGQDREIVASPRFLGRKVPALIGEMPRDTLARAVVGSDLFAKALVDRVWAQLFGRGIVEPWDDLGGESDPNHPALLGALADDFRRSGHDVKHLLRLLVLSRAYGLTSRAPAAATPDLAAAAFARAAVRRLTPEQLFRSLLVATGAEHFEQGGGAEIQKKIDRALREYLFVFGDDEMAEVDTFNGNVPQALLLLNGDITNQGAKARPGGNLARILSGPADPATRLRRVFLAAYARPPTAEESARLLPALSSGAGGDRAGWEDLFFALLTSTEMLTNH